MMAVLVSLLSCRSELLDYESQTNVAKKSYVAKQVTYEQLKQQFPLVAHKVSSLKKLTISSGINSKIYTDAVDEFSIDTEKSLYIEDDNGIKTYTFKVTTKESTPDILENLVLKDIGNNEFEAYIASYDKYAIENLAKLSVEEYRSHVTLIQLANKNGADIFGKYNANFCTISNLSDIINVYVPGTLCSDSNFNHNFSDYGICQAAVKPTSGHYESVFIYTTVDVCDGGGASPGNGPIVTTPNTGNNPGGGFGGGTANPCEKISELFANEKFKAKYDTLTKPKLFNELQEKAFVMKHPPIGTTGVAPAFISIDMPPCSTGDDEAVWPSVFDGITIIMHDHNNEDCNGNLPIKAPSPVDIKTFLNKLLTQANTFTGSYLGAASLTTTSGGNYMLMYNGTNYPGSLDYYAVEKLTETYKDMFVELYQETVNVTQADIERIFTKFLKEKINKPGLNVYRVTPTSASKLEYNPTSPNSVKETPCP